jgi:hypothetical protein
MTFGYRWYFLVAITGLLPIQPVAAQIAPADSRPVALVNARIYRSPEAAPIDNGTILMAKGRISAVGTRACHTLTRAAAVSPSMA